MSSTRRARAACRPRPATPRAAVPVASQLGELLRPTTMDFGTIVATIRDGGFTRLYLAPFLCAPAPQCRIRFRRSRRARPSRAGSRCSRTAAKTKNLLLAATISSSRQGCAILARRAPRKQPCSRAVRLPPDRRPISTRSGQAVPLLLFSSPAATRRAAPTNLLATALRCVLRADRMILAPALRRAFCTAGVPGYAVPRRCWCLSWCSSAPTDRILPSATLG